MKDKAVLRCLALIFLVAAAAMAWQLIHPGFYHAINDDAAMISKYVPQFTGSLREGVYYPRWMPEDFAGYGSPTFVFYSPLLYFIFSLLNAAGLGLPAANVLLEFLRLYAGGVFIFLLIRENHGTKAALAAGIFYILLPSRMLDLYHINTPAGRFAEAWMPMTLFFTRKMVEGPFSRRHLMGMSVSYSGLVLTHLITAYIFTPFIIAYGLIGTRGKVGPDKASRLALGLVLGISLSAFYFLPAIFERSQAQLELITRFDFRHNFVFAFSQWPVAPALRNLRLTSTNAAAVEVCLLGLVYYFGRRYSGLRLDRETGFFLAASVMCLFMMSSLSYFLWKYVPGLKTVAFPSRFAAVNLLFLPAFLGISLNVLLLRRAWPRPATAAAAMLLLAVLMYDIKIIAIAVHYKEHNDTASAAVFPEYLPKAVELDAMNKLKQEDPLLSSDDEYSFSITKWGSIDRIFAVDSPRGARLRVKTFYFPGWRAWADGKEVPLAAQDKTGAILMDVPAGRHDVRLKFMNTPPRTVGAIISLLTLAALVFLKLRRGRPPDQAP